MRILILSGGQTGVDRAALDAALHLGVAVGGWCPAGRWAEDGPIPVRYPLRETTSADPAERTQRNVADADALLVLAPGVPTGGTARAIDTARALGRTVWVADPTSNPVGPVLTGLQTLGRARPATEAVRVNVAGPRESEAPGVYVASLDWLGELLRRLSPPR